MGCYGFGVSRAMAGLVESHHDDNGIAWPMSVAPFQVAVLMLDPQVPELAQLAEEVAAEIEAAGYSVLLDDRDQRPGVKFKDADLIGYPLRVVIGKKSAEAGNVEVKRRRDGEERIVPRAEVVAAVQELA
jgi:prolyl-tRNA synthetase